MNFLPREQIIREMTGTLQIMIDVYQLEDAGIFEEEGEGEAYYVGYTVRKNGDVYMIHKPFMKNEAGELAPKNLEWVVETGEEDYHKYKSLDDVFTAITQRQIH
ncbi:DUF5634 family protein [Bacillaceae bacterium IKA-2]|nr:DUF5634 family protein [Bacillaceae bacterium IKA-2]